MKSRERVQTALAHQEPDRVPIDLGGTVVSTIAIPTYAALRRHLGLPEKPIETLEVVQQVARVDEDMLDLNPVQVSAAGMGTAQLKQRFGKRLSFWGGGCDTQKVLPYGTPAEVREEVRQRIRDLAPGGGFVFNPVHNIQPLVPPANVAAMFDAALEFGMYSSKQA
jgi:hypothetical protein